MFSVGVSLCLGDSTLRSRHEHLFGPIPTILVANRVELSKKAPLLGGMVVKAYRVPISSIYSAKHFISKSPPCRFHSSA